MPEQGEAYAKFIESELKYEYDRRVAVDARALAVMTTSSAFLALVFALTAFVIGSTYKFSTSGARGLVASLASFVVAAVLGLIANATRKYDVADAPTLRKMLAEKWTDHETNARNTCAKLSVDTIVSLRNGSNSKAGLTVVAFVFQIAAILGIVVTIAWELRDAIV